MGLRSTSLLTQSWNISPQNQYDHSKGMNSDFVGKQLSRAQQGLNQNIPTLRPERSRARENE